MCGRLDVKTPRRAVRIRRESAGGKSLEAGWSLVRFEPESGNAVCERGAVRVICPRREFEALNFPGSDAAWSMIADASDGELMKAGAAWAELDLHGTATALLRYARELDPAFRSIQILSDLDAKIIKIDEVCQKTLDLLRVETKRKRDEYERQTAANASGAEEKDELLIEVRDLEDRYAAQAYRHDVQLPEWRRLALTISNLEAAAKK
jgi:hypothetical protein